MFTMNWKAHVACNFYRFVETEALLKITGCHLNCKSCNISEAVQDICRGVIIT